MNTIVCKTKNGDSFLYRVCYMDKAGTIQRCAKLNRDLIRGTIKDEPDIKACDILYFFAGETSYI